MRQMQSRIRTIFRRFGIIVCCCAIFAGCSTTRTEVIRDSEPIERPKPVESMQPCAKALSQLPLDFVILPIEEALKLLLQQHVIDSATYFNCSRHKQALVEHIDGK